MNVLLIMRICCQAPAKFRLLTLVGKAGDEYVTIPMLFNL